MPHGLTKKVINRKYEVLKLLCRHKELTTYEVAAALKLNYIQAYYILKSLEKEGIIESKKVKGIFIWRPKRDSLFYNALKSNDLTSVDQVLLSRQVKNYKLQTNNNIMLDDTNQMLLPEQIKHYLLQLINDVTLADSVYEMSITLLNIHKKLKNVNKETLINIIKELVIYLKKIGFNVDFKEDIRPSDKKAKEIASDLREIIEKLYDDLITTIKRNEKEWIYADLKLIPMALAQQITYILCTSRGCKAWLRPTDFGCDCDDKVLR